MAQKSAGANCPVCGTLTACTGSFEDELLVGQCSLGHTVSVVNHRIERTDAGPAWVKVVGTPVDVPEPGAVARAAAPVPLDELPKDHPGSVLPNPPPEPNTFNAPGAVVTGTGVAPPQPGEIGAQPAAAGVSWGPPGAGPV